jgi:hypothetical protein
MGLGSCDGSDNPAGQASVRGRDTKSNSIRKIGLDRQRLTERVLGHAHCDREEDWRCRRRWGALREIDESKAAFPSVERTDGETFAGAELRDRCVTIDLAANTFAPECMELKVSRP